MDRVSVPLKLYLEASPPQFSSVQSLSHVQLFATPRIAAGQVSLSVANSQSLLKLMSLSQWCHPTISSYVVPLSSCLQSFPASGSFPMSQFFASGGQSIGVSASASVIPVTIQDWFPLGWTGLISLQSKGFSKVFSNTTVWKHHLFLWRSTFFIVQLSHPYMTTEKTRAFTRWTIVGKETPLLFNMLSRLVITFLPRSKCLLISWL